MGSKLTNWDVLKKYRDFLGVHMISSEYPENDFELYHYTNIVALESMLREKELWLSHPLGMNDSVEVRYLLNFVCKRFSDYTIWVDVFKDEEIAKSFAMVFQNCYDGIDKFNGIAGHVLSNVFLFCVTERGDANDNGILSFWREYSKDGIGVAIKIDVYKTNFLTNGKWFILNKVRYWDQDELEKYSDKMFERIREFVVKFGVKNRMFSCAMASFTLLILFLESTLVKSKNFEHENEWRLVYAPLVDMECKECLGYCIRNGFVEPKLKIPADEILLSPHFKIEGKNWTECIEKIIISPMVKEKEYLAMGLKTMFEKLGYDDLFSKIVFSNITCK